MPPENQTPPTASVDPAPRSGFLRMACVTGLALVLAVACGTFAAVHDGWITHTEFLAQNYLAPVVLAALIIPIIAINTLLKLRARDSRIALSTRELALVACLALSAVPLTRLGAWAWVSSVGHTRALIEARHPFVKVITPANNPYDRLPPGALLSPEESRKFDQGLIGTDIGLAGLGAIPWSVWVGPALKWAPLLGLFLLMSISLSVVLHSHWSNRELLSYPLSTLTGSLLEESPARPWPAVFSNGIFWAGLAFAFGIFLINGLHAHYEKMIDIPTGFNYYTLSQTFAFLKDSHEGYSLLRGTLFFAIISVAVLLPSEISLTAWFSWPVMVVASYVYFTQTGTRYTGADNAIVQLGASLGLVALVLYSGRGFYLSLLKSCIGLAPGETQVTAPERWYARAGILGAIGLIIALILWGFPWDIAILWTLGSIVFTIVVSRLVAEVGLLWVPLIAIGPTAWLVCLFGAQGMGPALYGLVAATGSVLLPSPVSALPIGPAVAHGLEVQRRLTPASPDAPSADAGLSCSPYTSLKLLLPFLACAFILGAIAHIWLGYSVSGETNDYFTRTGITEVSAAARLPASSTVPSLADRWSSIPGKPGTTGFVIFGAVLVLATGLLRIRFPRFPFHPLPFVLIGSWVLSRFWLSFFIGWFIKQAIIKIGGSTLFDKLKPFFTGLIAGQCLILVFWAWINILLYFTSAGIADPAWWAFFYDIFSA
jgi:hypothetical protein